MMDNIYIDMYNFKILESEYNTLMVNPIFKKWYEIYCMNDSSIKHELAGALKDAQA